MNWNHRVIRTQQAAGPALLTVHEVHYTSEGQLEDYNPATIVDGHDLDELRTMIDGMQQALNMPILDEADFECHDIVGFLIVPLHA